MRIVLWLIAGVVLLLAAGLVTLRSYLDAAFLEDVLNGAFVPATNGLYHIELGELSYSLLGGNMVVRDLDILPTRETIDSLNLQGVGPAVQFSARLDRVSIRGVAVIHLLWQRELEADEFSVRNPVVQITAVDRPRGSDQDQTETVDADSTQTGHQEASLGTQYLENLRHLAIKHVQIENVDASLVLVGPYGRDRKETNLTNRLINLSFNLENLVIDPAQPQNLNRIAFADDARIDFDLLHLELPGEQILEVGPVSSSTLDESIQIGSIEVFPTYSEEEKLAGQGPDGDRIELTTGPISIEGLDFRRAFSELSFHAQLAHVEKFAVDILSDKHDLSQTPNTAGPAPMPHDIFSGLRFPVTIDTLQFVGAAITYSERSPKAEEPGSITISEIDATVSSLSNNMLVATPESPTQISAVGNLFGTTRTWLDVNLPLMAPPPTMDLKVRIEGFDPTLANPILVPLEGMRVTKGEVDTGWVDIQYRPAFATGGVVVIYRDLDIRMEDRDTGKQNFGDKLGSIFADVGLRGGNDPDAGDKPRVGTVYYEISLDKPFFQLFWEAIRSGLVDLVNRF